MKRRLIWHGLVVVLLGLLTGAAVPAYANPRMGLSAHVGGVMVGTLVALVGAVWEDIHLSPGGQSALFWTGVYSAYVNWAGVFLAAVFGTGTGTPIAGAGLAAAPWQEALVAFCLFSGGGVVLVMCVIALLGLRPARA